MKTWLLGIPFILCAGAFADPPPLTGEAVLDRAWEAAGGKEAFGKITSMEETGDMSITSQVVGNNKINMLWRWKAPDRFFAACEIVGVMSFVMAHDGKTGWVSESTNGLRAMKPEELENLREGGLGLFDWRGRFAKATLKGTEKAGESEVYVVVCEPKTPKPGTVLTRRFDAKTFRLVSQQQVTDLPGGATRTETTLFSDYRTVEGITLPYEMKVEDTAPQETTTVKIARKFNVPVDDACFAKPPEKKPEEK